ncbi:MAG TPA: hypothetical protein VLE95_01185 [Chlamydiales bacterium]|nr:hypothetical protein [Chlamydiales bacterium]
MSGAVKNVLSWAASGAGSFLYSVTGETGLNLAKALPDSLAPSRPRYEYLNPLSPKAREIFVLTENDPTQQKVNAVFQGKFPFEKPNSDEVTILSEREPIVFEHSELPGFVLKIKNPSQHSRKIVAEEQCFVNTIERVSMAHTLREIIEKEHLDCLYVPQKKLAHFPGAPDDMKDGNYLVMAEKLDLTNPKDPIFMENMKREEGERLLSQLYTLMERSGYADGHRWNFAFIKSGPHSEKLAIYDTDPLVVFRDRFNERDWLSRAKERNLLNEEELRMREAEIKTREEQDVFFGARRDHDLKCASFAISETVSPERGLFIQRDIMEPVAEKFQKKISAEMRSNRLKASLLTFSSILTAVTAIGVQILINRL